MKQQSQKPSIKELEQRLNVITEYIGKMRSGLNEVWILLDSYIEMKGDFGKFQTYMKSKERKAKNERARKEFGK